ncbi:MAG: Holliday junction resolvase RuvX [Ignavibacteriales bacterium]|nr:MAG: Holliday junction resolvase RuvX [Ignavibacteriaceae bacterium]MBW7872149.1 Holliday junction resolvase RuvX [Ignavibacteria bacterium]MCZ2142267.1 Holliday junction resolvase RuvX [Ignavibacteriales bacterium]OQY78813.1 MAG: Holliday junction resolvase RuvX [Ignavibacteriales bacterium UTCHB3]MBV6445706.1 putative pre-16S rRNA nuclease [Ignavibacteriaceae bacterium]
MQRERNSANGRVLAIDYGTKRVGLALSDPMKIIATPFETWENSAKLIEKIAGLVIEKEVDTIVVGYPLNGDGSPTYLTETIEEFAEKLKKKTGVKVELYDERFSSSIASERILKVIKQRSKRQDKALVDKFAAAVILEDYLQDIG